MFDRIFGSLSTLALLAGMAATHANDVVIANGRVIDPETGLYAVRNVAVKGGRVAAISEFPLDGRTVIDAQGHAVVPGSIDLYAHGQNVGDHIQAGMDADIVVLANQPCAYCTSRPAARPGNPPRPCPRSPRARRAAPSPRRCPRRPAAWPGSARSRRAHRTAPRPGAAAERAGRAVAHGVPGTAPRLDPQTLRAQNQG